MNFTVEKNGPTIPNVPNQSYFTPVKMASIGGDHKFKAGDVVKMTAGKIRLRNAEEKNWTDANSAYAEKNDIITCTGPVYAQNQEKASDAHAACRVFSATK